MLKLELSQVDLMEVDVGGGFGARGEFYPEDFLIPFAARHVGGKVRLKVVKRIVRCAATNVDPVTAARDLNIPKTLMQTFNHMDCGIYAEVIEGGDIAAGNTVTA